MIKKLILNSNNCNTGYDYSNKGNLTYTLDWSFLDETKSYKVNFTFVSKQVASITGNSTYQISVPLTATAETYITTQRTNKVQTNVIGCIHPNLVGATNGQYKTTVNDNPAFTIHSRPSNNIINVQVLDFDNSTVVNIGVDYILTLYFEEM